MPGVRPQSHKFKHQEVFLPFKQGGCLNYIFHLYPAFLLCDLATLSTMTLAAGGKSKIGQTPTFYLDAQSITQTQRVAEYNSVLMP